MTASKDIANQFREVLLNGTWIASTNFQDQLSDLTWKQATTKVGNLNTIAHLTFHIHYYIAGILKVFEGGSLDIRDKYSFDLPPIESKKDWEQLLMTMWSDTEKFAQFVEKMSAIKLEEDFVNRKYGSYRKNIEGVIGHSYYHLGQISLIKKMVLDLE